LSYTSHYFTFSLITTLAFVSLASWWMPPREAAFVPATTSSLFTLGNAADAPQWRQLPGPGRVTVRAFLGSGQYLFAASDRGSVFRSANNGDNQWTRRPSVGEELHLGHAGPDAEADLSDAVRKR